MSFGISSNNSAQQQQINSFIKYDNLPTDELNTKSIQGSLLFNSFDNCMYFSNGSKWIKLESDTIIGTGITECTVGPTSDTSDFTSVQDAIDTGYHRIRIIQSFAEKNLIFNEGEQYLLYIDSGVTYSLYPTTCINMKNVSLAIWGCGSGNLSSCSRFSYKVNDKFLFTDISHSLSFWNVDVVNDTLATKKIHMMTKITGIIQAANTSFICSNASACLFGDGSPSTGKLYLSNCVICGGGANCSTAIYGGNSNSTEIILRDITLTGTFSNDVILFRTPHHCIDGLKCNTDANCSINICGTISNVYGKNLTIKISRSSAQLSNCNINTLSLLACENSANVPVKLDSIHINNLNVNIFDAGLPLINSTINNMTITNSDFYIINWENCSLNNISLFQKTGKLTIGTLLEPPSNSNRCQNVVISGLYNWMKSVNEKDPTLEFLGHVKNLQLHNIVNIGNILLNDKTQNISIYNLLGHGTSFISFGKDHIFNNIDMINSCSYDIHSDDTDMSYIRTTGGSFRVHSNNNKLSYIKCSSSLPANCPQIFSITGNCHNLNNIYLGSYTNLFGGAGGNIIIKGSRHHISNMTVYPSIDIDNEYTNTEISCDFTSINNLYVYKSLKHLIQPHVLVSGNHISMVQCGCGPYKLSEAGTSSRFDCTGKDIYLLMCRTDEENTGENINNIHNDVY
jgi:hypothetical protein